MTKTTMPFFSIIVACKNEEKYIALTLESILSQKNAYFEVIVADGKSDDRTLEVIKSISKKDSRVRVYSSDDNGVFGGMNNGIRRASGEYLLFINAKDRIADNHVLESAEAIIRKENPDILLGDYISDKLDSKEIIRNQLDDKFYKELRKRWGICHQAVIARREILAQGFEERFKFAADYNWFCDQLQLKRKIIKSDIIVSIYDAYGMTGMLYNKPSSDQECMEIACNHFDDAKEAWREEGIGTTDYGKKLKEKAVRKQYDLLNDIFLLYQKGYDFSGWFLGNNYKRAAIYGMHHLGKRLYDILTKSEVHISFVMDKRDFSGEYDEYIPIDQTSLPDTDIVVVTPLVEFYEVRRLLEEKDHIGMMKVVPIEALIAHMKRNFYLLEEK